MKSDDFGRACFAVMLFLLIAACLANNSTMATFRTATVRKVVGEKTGRTIDCRRTKEYRLVVVENPKRKSDSDPIIPEDLNIVVGDQVISKIELPKESEAKNFSLNSIKKQTWLRYKGGLGRWSIYYDIQFGFRCKENGFYFYRVKKESFSTTNPDSGKFWNKKGSKVTKIEPNLPIEKFVMTDYL